MSMAKRWAGRASASFGLSFSICSTASSAEILLASTSRSAVSLRLRVISMGSGRASMPTTVMPWAK
ncbi:hypothetical protein JCM24511_05153 [Saitozyma sp. JCM 24511]|nr:hypothetical protein JCM24511_05153 [Saitozyma sp. JCM 24511]